MIIVWAILAVLFVSFGLVVYRGAPYVPTKKATIETALSLVPLEKGDLFVDLGSGDGSVVLHAARKGFRAVGYELNPLLNIIARWRCRGLPVKIFTRDFWLTPLPPDAKAVFVFLAGPYMKKLTRKLKKEAGSRDQPLYLISNGFAVPGLAPHKSEGGLWVYKIC